MALKSKINKATYDGLNDILRAEYKADGDSYVLDTDDGNELRTALANAKRERDEAKTQAQATKAEADTLKAAGGNFATIEQSYKDKIAKLESDVATANAEKTKLREDIVLGGKAKEIAAKHFTVPDLLEGKIRERMELDPRDNTTIRWKDGTGKVSALTEADITKEFVDNAAYKSIVVANRASGGAGNATVNGGAGSNLPYSPPVTDDGKVKPLSSMSPKELAGHMAAKRAAAAAEGGNATV
jgi:hypothetical protein